MTEVQPSVQAWSVDQPPPRWVRGAFAAVATLILSVTAATVVAPGLWPSESEPDVVCVEGGEGDGCQELAIETVEVPSPEAIPGIKRRWVVFQERGAFFYGVHTGWVFHDPAQPFPSEQYCYVMAADGRMRTLAEKEGSDPIAPRDVDLDELGASLATLGFDFLLNECVFVADAAELRAIEGATQAETETDDAS